MSDRSFPTPADQAVLQSWRQNAAPWMTTIQQGHLESRRLVTNAAILETVVDLAPQSVLDVGCGEGWLTRELSARGMTVTGVDGVPELVAAAQARGGDFRLASYEEIAAGALDLRVDGVVCNFSLLGETVVADLMRTLPTLIHPQGYGVIQTLHPLVACGDLPYQDGWRWEDWTGCAETFQTAAPWYFRTLASWMTLFEDSGLRLRSLQEPLHPQTQKPASVIFVVQGQG